MDGHRYEHSRTRLGALPSRAWEVIGPRMLRPLVGGMVGAAIVVLFLAIRGGTAVELNELTGTAWRRLEPSRRRSPADRGQRRGRRRDRRELRRRVDPQLAVYRAVRGYRRCDDRAAPAWQESRAAGGNILLGLIAFFLALGVGIGAWDVRSIGRRSGY